VAVFPTPYVRYVAARAKSDERSRVAARTPKRN